MALPRDYDIPQEKIAEDRPELQELQEMMVRELGRRNIMVRHLPFFEGHKPEKEDGLESTELPTSEMVEGEPTHTYSTVIYLCQTIGNVIGSCEVYTSSLHLPITPGNDKTYPTMAALNIGSFDMFEFKGLGLGSLLLKLVMVNMSLRDPKGLYKAIKLEDDSRLADKIAPRTLALGSIYGKHGFTQVFPIRIMDGKIVHSEGDRARGLHNLKIREMTRAVVQHLKELDAKVKKNGIMDFEVAAEPEPEAAVEEPIAEPEEVDEVFETSMDSDAEAEVVLSSKTTRLPFSISSPRYIRLFKDLLHIFRRVPTNKILRSNNGNYGCRWSALGYLYISAMYAYDIPEEKEGPLFEMFVNSIFHNRHGFDVESYHELLPLQQMYVQNKSIPEWVTTITTPEELLAHCGTATLTKPTVLTMGISREHDGSEYICHFFNMVVFRDGEAYRMFIVSSYGSEFVSIHQYGTEITKAELVELIADITEEERLDVRLTKGSIGGNTSLEVDAATNARVRASPMYKFFLDASHGIQRRVDGEDVPFGDYSRMKQVLVRKETASSLEYAQYKSAPGKLVLLNHVEGIVRSVFDQFMEDFPEYPKYEEYATRTLAEAKPGGKKNKQKQTRRKKRNTRNHKIKSIKHKKQTRRI